jgi:glycosyltransferase involved in cell wall biosynthesis
MLEIFLYKRSKRIIVLFENAVEYVRQKSVNKEKVLYIPTGVDISRYTAHNQGNQSNNDFIFKNLSEKFIAIYTGAHGIVNYLDVILDAAVVLQKKNNNIHFVLIGDGPEMERLIKRKESEKINNISFFPSNPKTTIPNVLNKAHVGLLAMRNADVYKYGVSMNKIFDYMASGLPIIVLNEQAVETPIEKSNGGLTVSNPEDMASAIEKLALDEELLKKLKSNSRSYVEENHSWEKLSERLINVMEDDLMI